MDRTTYPQRHPRSAAPKSFQSTPRKEKYSSAAATAVQRTYCRIFVNFLSIADTKLMEKPK